MSIVCLHRQFSDNSNDPVTAVESTEATASALEGIGAAVECETPGQVFFALDGLLGLYGGTPESVVAAARSVVDQDWRVGVGSTRFAALLAAGNWPRPVSVVALQPRLRCPQVQADRLIDSLRRLGIETLDALARLSADHVADRFGPPGIEALRICHGDEDPLRPRTPCEEIAEEIELPEGIAGPQLDRAVDMLIDRLLAAPQRKERTLLGLRLGASLSSGGSWSADQILGQPSGSPRVLRNLLIPRLAELPGPASTLRLRVTAFGPPAGSQLELSVGGPEPRRRRLGSAVREVRAVQGPEALLKILPVDAASRVPERWAILTPYPEL